MPLLLAVWRPLCYLQFAVMLIIFTVLGLTPAPGNYVPMYNDWLMHFTGYVAAGISISFTFPRTPWFNRALFLVVFSIGIEIGQHFMPPRTFSLMDIVANTSGVLTGLGIFWCLKRLAPASLLPFFNGK